MEEKKKVVVAFSGGLDTSFTVMYLAKEKGYEVYAACANTGGFSPEQLKKNEENAYKLGATKYVTLDVTKEYYEKSLKYMVFGNVLRNGTYPISVSSERIFQALAIARYANEIGAHAIAHGSTGAGNDQVRFDMTFLVMAPGVEIITLTRDMALSRDYEINYLKEHGFEADFTKLKYSYNVGIWGTSICGGEILDSTQGLPESAYLKQVTKTGSEQLKLEFKKGELKATRILENLKGEFISGICRTGEREILLATCGRSGAKNKSNFMFINLDTWQIVKEKQVTVDISAEFSNTSGITLAGDYVYFCAGKTSVSRISLKTWKVDENFIDLTKDAPNAKYLNCNAVADPNKQYIYVAVSDEYYETTISKGNNVLVYDCSGETPKLVKNIENKTSYPAGIYPMSKFYK